MCDMRLGSRGQPLDCSLWESKREVTDFLKKSGRKIKQEVSLEWGSVVQCFPTGIPALGRGCSRSNGTKVVLGYIASKFKARLKYFRKKKKREREKGRGGKKNFINLEWLELVHVLRPRTWEAEAGGSPWIWDQPGLHCEFQALQSHIVSWVFKKMK